MIDLKTFSNEITLLADWYGRSFNESTLQRLYDTLNEAGMTTEEFLEACKRIFKGQRFFPIPNDFLEASRGDTEGQALKEWKVALAAIKGSRQHYAKLNPVSRQAIDDLGGLTFLQNQPESDNAKLQEKFVKRWIANVGQQPVDRSNGYLPASKN